MISCGHQAPCTAPPYTRRQCCSAKQVPYIFVVRRGPTEHLRGEHLRRRALRARVYEFSRRRCLFTAANLARERANAAVVTTGGGRDGGIGGDCKQGNEDDRQGQEMRGETPRSTAANTRQTQPWLIHSPGRSTCSPATSRERAPTSPCRMESGKE